MSKYIKIGTYKDKSLYYNPENDAFYAMNEGIISPELDIINQEKEIEIIKNIATRITDEDEIKAIKMANYYVLDHLDKEEKLYASIHKLHERDAAQKVIESKRMKRARTISLIMLAITLLYQDTLALGREIKLKVEDKIDEYHATHQNDEKHLEIFLASLEANETLDAKFRLPLQRTLNALVVSDVYISNDVVKRIGKRIEEYDFSHMTEETYPEIVPYLIFGENNIIARSIFAQLDEHINNTYPSKISTLFGELCACDHNDTLEYFFSHDTNSFIKYLAKSYNVETSEINDLLNILSMVRISSNEEERAYYENEYHRILGNMLVDRLKGHNPSAYSRYLLSTSIFGGNNIVYNNIFKDYTSITMYTDKYKSYELYFDPTTGIDLSLSIYYDSLAKLIKSKGNNLNYQDPDCRFLIYLLYLSHTDAWDYDELAFADYNTPEDMANKLITDVCSPYGGKVRLDPEFVYAYLSSGYINFDVLIDATYTPFESDFSLALFGEFYKCIMEEIKAGNLSYSTYEEDFTRIFSNIKENNPKNYDTLMDSLNTGTSLINDITLYPFTYTTPSEDTKKNVYTPTS